MPVAVIVLVFGALLIFSWRQFRAGGALGQQPSAQRAVPLGGVLFVGGFLFRHMRLCCASLGQTVRHAGRLPDTAMLMAEGVGYRHGTATQGRTTGLSDPMARGRPRARCSTRCSHGHDYERLPAHLGAPR